MKPRVPDTFEHAVYKIFGELGIAECAKTIGKSESLIRQAADPDSEFTLNLNQALLLDKAYMEKTGRFPPLAASYMRALGQKEPALLSNEQIAHSALDIVTEVGEFFENLKSAISKKGAGGKEITPNEAHKCLEELHDVKRVIAPIEDHLKRATKH